jgi:DNA-directed RNA polymerase subunit RPC12/RpoP
MQIKCPSCGSENLEPGRLESTGRVYFRPKNAKFLSLKSANIEVEANICTECGHIMLVGDEGKARALVSGREDPA